jgi:hypothetical protein
MVAVLRCVLVEHRRMRAGMAGTMHQLGNRGPLGGGPSQAGVAEVVETEVEAGGS